jgi:hypothetical protein
MSEQMTLAPAVDPLADVIAWSKREPLAWQAVVAWAHEMKVRGRVSTRTIACLLRDPDMATAVGLTRRLNEPVLVNDHWTSGWARLLNRLYPHLEVPCRKARSDGYGAVGGEAS